MLQSIHDKSKGILGIIIVILIGATFALWGIGDYLGDGQERSAARVGDVEISQRAFEQGLAQQRQRLEQMFQGQIPDSPIFEQQMKAQVLEQLITQQVLKKMVADEGYQVDDQFLSQKIQAMEAFQEDGVFAMDAYRARIYAQGMGLKEFEALYRNDLAIQQLQDGITRSSLLGDKQLEILNNIQQQTRDINYLQYNNADFIDQVKISDDEIADYFDSHQARFMHPETVSISYVELTAAELDKSVEVDESAVKQLYDDYVSSLSSKEQRKARHILVKLGADASKADQDKAKAKVDELLARLKKGEKFEELAKVSSQDPGSAQKGGDLGWVSRGMMVPEFEAALFKLQKGQLSDPVKSSFGYHIIRLDETKSQAAPSFASKKAELEAQYKAKIIEERFYDKSELMTNTAYENDQSLQAVADAMQLPIKTTPAFTRTQGSGVAANEKVRQAAFDPATISEGRNSDIIEMGKSHILVLRVDSHSEAKPKALQEVKTQIVAALKNQKAQQHSREAAEKAMAELKQGGDINNKKLQTGAKLSKLGQVKRDNRSADQQVIREAFRMPKPAEGQVEYQLVETATGTALLQLKSVKAPQAASAEQLKILARQYQNEQANRDMAVILEYLKAQTDIVRLQEQ